MKVDIYSGNESGKLLGSLDLDEEVMRFLPNGHYFELSSTIVDKVNDKVQLNIRSKSISDGVVEESIEHKNIFDTDGDLEYPVTNPQRAEPVFGTDEYRLGNDMSHEGMDTVDLFKKRNAKGSEE